MNKREAEQLDALYVTWIKRADLYAQLADNFQVDSKDHSVSEGYRVLKATTQLHADELLNFINDHSRLEVADAN